MNLLKVCNKIIEYSFYALFLLVPLAFTSATSELFELNKMWLTWGLTIIIGTSWFIKMVLQRRILFQRTPLDIPIGLFLLSQIISTIFSLDSRVSFWGYYSRFNGGLLSIISYIFLYYAFLSNFARGDTTGRDPDTAQRTIPKEYFERAVAGGKVGAGPRANETEPRFVKRLLSLSLISGLIVALWGLPSHFGYDPTCLLFRGTLDVSCWTQDFQPKARIFSTLGQPDWLAAYLAILIPIVIAYAIKNSKSEVPNPKQSQNSNSRIFKTFLNFGNLNLFRISIFVLLILFYVDLLYTRARSGFLGVWISLVFFFVAYFFMAGNPFGKSFDLFEPERWSQSRRREIRPNRLRAGRIKFSILTSHLSLPIGLLLLITFVIGTPINQFRSFTLEGIGSHFQKIQAPKNPPVAPSQPPTRSIESGGTESGDIRLNVWEGAINAWKNNPIFGTGVETFAFAYYKYKPAGQNLTSEWNFLYNKAHNEYLNYLATTGIVGLGTYLGMIGFFFTIVILRLKAEGSQILRFAQNDKTLILALLASYISVLVTNFFGFSVVITNIYLFMIPAFVFVLTGMLPRSESGIKNPHFAKASRGKYESRNLYQWTFIFFIILASIFMILNLFRFWQADTYYALGYNLDRAGEYQQAYPHLHKAVELRGGEPVFKDELSINDAIIASSLITQLPQDHDQSTKDKTQAIASTLTQEAINTSNEIIVKHPNNAVFWKTRTRVFYTLSQVDSRYLPKAVDAIEKASVLAPKDANILYNLGVLYGQNNNIQKGIEALEQTVKLKPDYRDARYALGLYYHTASLDTAGKVVIDSALQKKALDQMQYILDHFNPLDTQALESIKSWGK